MSRPLKYLRLALPTVLLACAPFAAVAGEMRAPRVSVATPDWDAAAKAAGGKEGASPASVFTALNEVSAKRYAGIAEAPIPVLVPFDIAALEDKAKADTIPGGFRASQFFLPGPAGYHATFFINGGEVSGVRYQKPIEIEISGAHFFYELDGPSITETAITTPKNLEEFPGIRRVLREAHIRYAFEKFGVPYVVSIECFDGRVTPRRLACKDADIVATRFLKTLNVAGGSPGKTEPYVPLALVRPQVTSQSFTYYPPGDLIANSGYRGLGGRNDDTVYSMMRFPIAEAPAFAKSQSFNSWGDCYKTGRVGRYNSKGAQYRCRRNSNELVFDEGAAENFSYPWRDNFCETRDTQVGQCPGGIGHQGQDLRPSSCVTKNNGADRCEPYQHDVVAVRDGMILRNPPSYVIHETAYIVVNTASENVRFRYMHMHPQQMDDAGLLSGKRVRQGEVLGKVGNFYKKEKGTSYHLHFDAQAFTRDGWVWVNPYMTLVASYERLIGARGTELSQPVAVASAGGEVPMTLSQARPEPLREVTESIGRRHHIRRKARRHH